MMTATLQSKTLLSETSQTWELTFECSEPLLYTPGQFYSFVTPRDGKDEVRAYSLTHTSDGKRMTLCLNRAGFFSNMLCDLQIGGEVSLHGPYGAFVLRDGPGIVVADGPGIAPVAAMTESLLQRKAKAGPLHLVHAVPAPGELFYRALFERAQSEVPGFHYMPIPESTASEVEMKLQSMVDALGETKPTAYIVGMNAFAAPIRQWFKDRGWDRKQIVFERYD